jgi:hypothetical protein
MVIPGAARAVQARCKTRVFVRAAGPSPEGFDRHKDHTLGADGSESRCFSFRQYLVVLSPMIGVPHVSKSDGIQKGLVRRVYRVLDLHPREPRPEKSVTHS